tara:strand:- start:12364 stop:12975 length:612 start_codon:yes stop_codon:yes gene_type:complete
MISIINYGLGNINAFINVYNTLNVKVKVIDNYKEISLADKIVLPGVGAFDKAMSLLEKKSFVEPLKDAVLVKKTPILGICVGMQIMANSSEEGIKNGLGLIDGKILNLKNYSNNNEPVPHMGWNSIKIINRNGLLDKIHFESYFYFLHSYFYECDNKNHITTSTNYIKEFSSTINKDNVFGVQFHPEKSHENGAQILENFSNL